VPLAKRAEQGLLAAPQPSASGAKRIAQHWIPNLRIGAVTNYAQSAKAPYTAAKMAF
jgi:hypothetical protein